MAAAKKILQKWFYSAYDLVDGQLVKAKRAKRFRDLGYSVEPSHEGSKLRCVFVKPTKDNTDGFVGHFHVDRPWHFISAVPTCDCKG